MRLIDADKLVYELTELVRTNTGEYKNGIAVARLVVMDSPTVGGWISVENKLPEKNGDYLVVTSFFDRRRIEVLTFVQDLEKLDSYDFHGKRRQGFADYNSEYGFSERKVSHWMPLPEPPKGEE